MTLQMKNIYVHKRHIEICWMNDKLCLLICIEIDINQRSENENLPVRMWKLFTFANIYIFYIKKDNKYVHIIYYILMVLI